MELSPRLHPTPLMGNHTVSGQGHFSRGRKDLVEKDKDVMLRMTEKEDEVRCRKKEKSVEIGNQSKRLKHEPLDSSEIG